MEKEGKVRGEGDRSAAKKQKSEATNRSCECPQDGLKLRPKQA